MGEAKLKIKVVGSSEMLVYLYQTAWHFMPIELSFWLLMIHAML
jgi:hypothetical protein